MLYDHMLSRFSSRFILVSVVLVITQGCALGTLIRYGFAPGEKPVSGMQFVRVLPEETLTIYWTEKGFPSVMAETITGAVWGQGYLHGADRLFQLDMVRHVASGRLSEWAGEKVLPADQMMRRLDFYGLARRQMAVMSPRTIGLLQSLADGVNHAATTTTVPMEYKLLGEVFTTWQPIDSVALLNLVSWNFSANLRDEILGARLLASLGPLAWKLFPTGLPALSAQQKGFSENEIAAVADDRLMAALKILDELFHEGGSNNWAITAERSASGAPMLANDPHLVGNLIPTLLYPVGLHWLNQDAAGFGIPGLPGVLAGRNRTLAWGLTNNYGDVQDLVIERVSEDGESYMLNGSWTPFAKRTETYRIRKQKGTYNNRTETILNTVRGPVVHGFAFGSVSYDVTETVSLVWAPAVFVKGDLRLAEMMEATNTSQLLAASATYTGAPMNLVYADVKGGIGHQVIGVVPMRRGNNGAIPVLASSFPAGITMPWEEAIPFAELPRLVESEGWVGTANHNVAGENYPYPYSSRFAPGYRYERLKDLFADGTTWDTTRSEAAQNDDISWFAVQMLPLIRSALNEHMGMEPFSRLFADWNGAMDAKSTAPLVFHLGMRRFIELSLEDDLPAELLKELVEWPYFYHERMLFSVLNSSWYWADDRRTPARETASDKLVQAFGQVPALARSEFGHSWDKLVWGDVHQIYFRHPFKSSGFAGWLLGDGPHPLSGDADTLMRAGSQWQKPFAVDMIAAVRFVSDLGDACWLEGIAATGQSGRWRSPHYHDAVKDYVAGRYQRWPVCPEAVRGSAANTLYLRRGVR